MIKWYIVPYATRMLGDKLTRYPAIDDYTPQINAVGGKWAEVEILGNRCIVKVKTSSEIHTQLGSIYKTIPVKKLDDIIPSNKRKAFKNELLDMGYKQAEIAEYYNTNTSPTFRDFILVATKRRLKPRYVNAEKTEIAIDGDPVNCDSITNIDAQVIE